MDFFPAFLNLKKQPCLLVGGGSVALRKAQLLLQSGATLTVVAPQILSEIRDLNPAPSCLVRPFEESDLQNTTLVIVATSNRALNAEISVLARAQNIPVNVVDDPALCSFIVPSVIDRSPIVVAVSSSGAAPVLARQTRAKIEAILPAKLGMLATLAQKYRQAVKDRFSKSGDRRLFWERLFESDAAEKVYSGHLQAAEARLQSMLDSEDSSSGNTGEVALIGGGPGDPDLLTFKAVRLLQRADVIVYDRLISDEIVNLARKDARKIYAGKAKSNHAIPQEDINKLLVELAQQGNRVVRLKGGDPFIFGRGGEEISELIEYEIPFQVVPGITAASGCSTYSGIPLTHRDYAQSVLFVTGHLKNNTVNLNWQALAHKNQTSVIYMGLGGLKIIADNLIAHQLPATTPVAVIHKGTTAQQRTVIGDLSNIAERVEIAKLSSPCMIIIGEVVTLHKQLHWYKESESG